MAQREGKLVQGRIGPDTAERFDEVVAKLCAKKGEVVTRLARLFTMLPPDMQGALDYAMRTRDSSPSCDA